MRNPFEITIRHDWDWDMEVIRYVAGLEPKYGYPAAFLLADTILKRVSDEQLQERIDADPELKKQIYDYRFQTEKKSRMRAAARRGGLYHA